ncbi:hypothetical protein N781_08975 [Pontibacillus halophilus JSM 076056 = DSM 19796]|uniref:Prenyltransferase alpha-alpha toroid domain-containing protein n=1 Tax=Pontibacillus halophilus JSM 076056 = DSM 19796 TaxID=1385510 RepID=A0A0A5GFE2_9BACI|nr:hypothetical protein [Pontibacillus halophilus]KGX89840.1 hypothetical protein N781_08975 [Pontibacillus halophilus JSM 076056 = DSM 19796]
MRKWYVGILIALVFTVGGVVLVLQSKEASSQLSAGSLEEGDWDDVSDKLLSSWKESGDFSLTNGLEDIQSLYNTYYGNALYALLGEELEVCSYVHEEMAHRDFTNASNLGIFNEVEALYAIDSLLEQCEIPTTDVYRQQIKDVASQTFMKDAGVFLAKEMKNFSDDPQYTGVKLSETYQMLRVMERNKVDTSDYNSRVTNYLDSVVSRNGKFSPSRAYFLINSFDILGKQDASVEVEEPTLDGQADVKRMVELDYYTKLYQGRQIKASSERMNRIESYLKDSFKSDVADIQYVYRNISALRSIGASLHTSNKKILLDNLNLYEDNGQFTKITSYSADLNQNMMGYSLLHWLQGTEYSNLAPLEDKVSSYTYQDFKDLSADKQLSFLTLQQILRVDVSFLDQAESFLLEEIRKPIKQGSIFQWTYQVEALQLLRSPLKAHELPNQAEQLLDSIINGNKYFNQQSELANRAFIDAMSQTDAWTDKVHRAVKGFSEEEIKPDSEAAAYMIYYTYHAMRQTRIQYDDTTLLKKLDALRRQGGYAVTDEDSYMDLRSTYFTIKLIKEIIIEDKGE